MLTPTAYKAGEPQSDGGRAQLGAKEYNSVMLGPPSPSSSALSGAKHHSAVTFLWSSAMRHPVRCKEMQ
jgi:hypothetical protein